MRIKFIIIIIVIIFIAFLGWLFWASTRPLPGEKLPDLGREHIEIGKEVTYNSNPPTSGSHYVDWVRAGVYTELKDDRNLVHSLEHGYVVMSYRCTSSVIATPSEATPEAGEARGKQSQTEVEIATSASGETRNDDTEECNQRKAQLEEIYNKKGKKKLIVVARPNLDTNFAVTAWNYLDKFDPSTSSGLSDFDVKRIEKFIDAHRDNGPERTME